MDLLNPESNLKRVSKSMNYEVKQLSERPECLGTVGAWIYNQWWSKRYDDPEVVFSWLRTHTRKDTVPFTVVAFADGVPIGSCSVIQNDCKHRMQYTPWVAAVYVKPEMRGRGIASMILQEAAAVATRANVAGLYIDCLATTAPVYERNGWTTYEREVGDKESVVMLRITGSGNRNAC
jgi:GNAT superfamily N-acetyltransferase